MKKLVSILLSLCLGVFLADAIASLVDDSLILLYGVHMLAVLRGILFSFAILMAVVIYGLMGLTPTIPKRLFLPLTLFSPVAGLVLIPFVIYFYSRAQQVAWVISFCQVILGLGLLYAAQGGFKMRWPLVTEDKLEAPRFSWNNLLVFLGVNVFVLLPAVAVYLVFCTALAVDHFSEGFVAMRPGGFSVQVRKYVRDDGKVIQLYPMSHVAERAFYRKLSQSFPTNSIILMEGVSDDSHLLTNKITYKRLATSLGVAEQVEEFKPSRGKMVRADVDVEEFSTNTIDFLNLVMLLNTKGVNAENVMKLLQFSPPAGFDEQLFDDLLGKRNRHLVEQIQARLAQSEIIIVPWGVAHMPQIAAEIQKSGFRLDETSEFITIRFHFFGHSSEVTGNDTDVGKLK